MTKAKRSPGWKKAATTDRWTEILFRALAARVAQRWRFVSFRGTGGREWRGVVDVLAIRKDTMRSRHAVLKSGDLFEIVLVQMKGGTAAIPTRADVRRLQTVARRYHAMAIVLFEWTRGQRPSCRFSRWQRGRWRPATSLEIFG